MCTAAKEGYHCTIAFVIQMNGIHRVFPNEATVGKEDLEEMGTAMTLDLLEDGTGTMDYDGTVYDLTWDDSSITMEDVACLLYTSPSPRDGATSRMPSSA